MMVNNGLEFFYFEIRQAPSEIPANLTCPANSALLGRFILPWAAATLKGLGEFKKKVLGPFIIIIFKQKMSISCLENLVHL